MQFALAGMNAHINHDLPIAMVSTCTTLATSPETGPHIADYQKVDQLLDAAEQSIRQSFESAQELAVDRHLSAVASLIANCTINSARGLAWSNCLLLWAVRDDVYEHEATERRSGHLDPARLQQGYSSLPMRPGSAHCAR